LPALILKKSKFPYYINSSFLDVFCSPLSATKLWLSSLISTKMRAEKEDRCYT